MTFCQSFHCGSWFEWQLQVQPKNRRSSTGMSTLGLKIAHQSKNVVAVPKLGAEAQSSIKTEWWERTWRICFRRSTIGTRCYLWFVLLLWRLFLPARSCLVQSNMLRKVHVAQELFCGGAGALKTIKLIDCYVERMVVTFLNQNRRYRKLEYFASESYHWFVNASQRCKHRFSTWSILKKSLLLWIRACVGVLYWWKTDEMMSTTEERKTKLELKQKVSFWNFVKLMQPVIFRTKLFAHIHYGGFWLQFLFHCRWVLFIVV